jgi:hypothetical protein
MIVEKISSLWYTGGKNTESREKKGLHSDGGVNK